MIRVQHSSLTLLTCYRTKFRGFLGEAITALNKFEGLSEAVSLTDCIVMAVADEYGTKDIFGFDKQFADAGYTRLAPSTEWK